MDVYYTCAKFLGFPPAACPALALEATGAVFLPPNPNIFTTKLAQISQLLNKIRHHLILPATNTFNVSK